VDNKVVGGHAGGDLARGRRRGQGRRAAAAACCSRRVRLG
jgi:hypothetical protein